MAEQVRVVVVVVVVLVWLLRHGGVEDGELLQPLQAGQAVVQADGVAGAAGAAGAAAVPLLGLSSGGDHLLLQLHQALRPAVGTAQRQHGSLFLRHLSPSCQHRISNLNRERGNNDASI